MSGKGSRPRPLSVDHDTFANNWDAIFKTEQQRIREISELVAEVTLGDTEPTEHSRNFVVDPADLEDPDRVGN